MNKLNIGILGASKIAPDSVIGPAKKISRISIIGIAASSPEKAKKYALQHEIPYSTGDYDELIQSDLIDLVYVSLKNDMHYEYAIKAIKNEKHVLIEKPICLNFKEYQEIEEQALKYNVVVLEAMMVRHHPWQDAIPKVIREKGYGKIKQIVSCNNFMLEGENNFRIVSKHGGGAIYDLGCYCIQFIQQITGLDFKTIACHTDSYGPNKIETEFHARLTDEAVNVEIYCSFRKPFQAYHMVECERGTIEVKNFFRAGFGFNKMHLHLTDKASGLTEIVSFEPMNYYYNQLIDLLDTIDSGNFINQLTKSGIRVRLMEKLQAIKELHDHF
jgi:dTDP-3,4-didehydro-2,6-dideoxy-alpha-D-glucose 3-reductase